jgi:hypothetical protein
MKNKVKNISFFEQKKDLYCLSKNNMTPIGKVSKFGSICSSENNSHFRKTLFNEEKTITSPHKSLEILST